MLRYSAAILSAGRRSLATSLTGRVKSEVGLQLGP
jgi:hypothetical protein